MRGSGFWIARNGQDGGYLAESQAPSVSAGEEFSKSDTEVGLASLALQVVACKSSWNG